MKYIFPVLLLILSCKHTHKAAEFKSPLELEKLHAMFQTLEDRIFKLEKYHGPDEYDEVERRTPLCQEGTVSMWDDAKKEFYCLAN